MLAKRVSRKAALCTSAAIGLALAFGAQAHAQTTNYGPPPPPFPTLDRNGVDLTTGALVLSDLGVSVGDPGQGGLARVLLGPDARDNLSGTLTQMPDGTAQYPDQSLWTVSFGAVSATFLQHLTNGPLTPFSNAAGRSMTYNSANNTYAFTDRDGTVAVFDASLDVINQITRPNGEVISYTYHHDASGQCGAVCLPQAITSSLGYMIHYDYVTDSLGNLRLSKVTAINRTKDACDPSAVSCTLTYTWPSISFSWSGSSETTGTLTATDALNRVTTYTVSNDLITQITRPSGLTWAFGYDASNRVHTASTGGRIWTYDYTTLSNGDLQTVVTDPTGKTQTLETNYYWTEPTAFTDGAGSKTIYDIDSQGRVDYVENPEQDTVSFAFDARSNINSITRTPKPGSNLPAFTTTLNYDSTCSNTKTCNEPNSIVKAGVETDFTYDANSGQVTSVTSPADANGVRPQVRYTYSSLTPSYLNGAGQVVTDVPVWKLTQVSSCITQASCIGTSDESRAVFDYGSSSPNNLLLVSSTQQDGTGALSAQTQYAYDIRGDVKTVDGPLAGASDTTLSRYDVMREFVGRVEVDPDGQSAGRPARAEKVFYTPDGLLSYTQYGAVPSQSDTDWTNAFTKLYTEALIRDTATRVTQAQFKDSTGAIQGITQYTYYDNDQVECAATRMNPSVFSSLPASACTAGAQGSFGPDRITYFGYDSAARLSQTSQAYGTTDQSDQTLSYTANGRPYQFTDGDGNVTTFAYDGFDRPSQMNFPSPTTHGQSSPTDYVQATYDNTTWNLASERLRDGTVINYTYDNLHRLLAKDQPAATTYGYDLMSHTTSAAAGGQTVTATYDALGRRTAETGPLGTVASQYDAASRRTRLTLPSGFYTTYDYDFAGAMTDIKDAGGTALVTFGYDTADRLQSLTRSDGVDTTYGYDNASRLTNLTHTYPGAASGDSVTVTLARNPANGISGRTLSNNAYEWSGTKATTTYDVNGLNQITDANGVSFTYNARGDLTSDGAKSYGYDTGDRLTSAGTATYGYDPLDRLQKSVGAAGTTQYVYDGSEVVAEYDGNGAELRRYVRGPGLDQPLAIYESGTVDWPLADERGSIMGLADNTGGELAIDTYDEYGLPGAANAGTFQYTGQMWLPDAGLYNYKARAYSATWGRFLQTDPISYQGGQNLYAYVGNDPINAIDPSGLDWEFVHIQCIAACGTTQSTLQAPPIVVTAPAPPGFAPFSGANAGATVGAGGGSGGGASNGAPNRSAKPTLACPAALQFAGGLDRFAQYSQRAAGGVAVASLIPQAFGGPINPGAVVATGAGESLAGVLEVSSVVASATSGFIHFVYNGNPVPLAITALTAGLGPASGLKGPALHIANTVSSEATQKAFPGC